MDITLTDVEVNVLTELQLEDEKVEDVLHRLLHPMVEKQSEARLQTLANQYRLLTPELQIEVIKLLREWQASKIPPPDAVPVNAEVR